MITAPGSTPDARMVVDRAKSDNMSISNHTNLAAVSLPMEPPITAT